MTKLVCVKCQTELRPFHNGTIVIETASFGPYKVWNADTLKCPSCNIEIVGGFADCPMRSDHYASDFLEWLRKLKAKADKIVYDNERPTS